MSRSNGEQGHSRNRRCARSLRFTMYLGSLVAVCLGPVQGRESAVVIESASQERLAKALGDRPLLALPGHDSFRQHHQQLHEQMTRLGILHLYRDGPPRKHHWGSGWLPEAAAWILHGEWTSETRGQQGRLQVFILAGQSNMEGQAVVDLDHEQHYNSGRGTLKRLLDDPAKAPLLRHLRDEKGEWVIRDDVWVWYQPEKGDLKAGALSVGYAVYPGKHHFGPELQFGHVLGEYFEEPVLLIKTAWGGKSLAVDFRPPSAGGETGPYYKKMVAQIHEVLGSLEAAFSGYHGQGYDLRGFVWFQGWNDMIDQKATAEYEANLAHLIRDIRRELKVPDLPVVIGETGNCDNLVFRKAQAAVAERPELRGTVSFVPTAEFRRPAEDSPNTGHGHHWFGNAESYFLIGQAFGDAMKKLLDLNERNEGRGDPYTKGRREG